MVPRDSRTEETVREHWLCWMSTGKKNGMGVLCSSHYLNRAFYPPTVSTTSVNCSADSSVLYTHRKICASYYVVTKLRVEEKKNGLHSSPVSRTNHSNSKLFAPKKRAIAVLKGFITTTTTLVQQLKIVYRHTKALLLVLTITAKTVLI